MIFSHFICSILRTSIYSWAQINGVFVRPCCESHHVFKYLRKSKRNIVECLKLFYFFEYANLMHHVGNLLFKRWWITNLNCSSKNEIELHIPYNINQIVDSVCTGLYLEFQPIFIIYTSRERISVQFLNWKHWRRKFPFPQRGKNWNN